MSRCIFSKIVNKSKDDEDEELDVLTVWSDTKVEIIIVRSEIKMVSRGEASLEEFSLFAEAYGKSVKELWLENQDIFSGNNEDITFFLCTDSFYWKKKSWVRGKISMRSTPKTECDADLLLVMMRSHTDASELQKVCDCYKNEVLALKTMLNEVLESQKLREATMYKKFSLVLNTKKAKNRELRDILKVLKPEDERYYTSTQESDTEPSDSKNNASHSSLIFNNANKRLSESNNNNLDKKRARYGAVEIVGKKPKKVTTDEDRKMDMNKARMNNRLLEESNEVAEKKRKRETAEVPEKRLSKVTTTDGEKEMEINERVSEEDNVSGKKVGTKPKKVTITDDDRKIEMNERLVEGDGEVYVRKGKGETAEISGKKFIKVTTTAVRKRIEMNERGLEEGNMTVKEGRRETSEVLEGFIDVPTGKEVEMESIAKTENAISFQLDEDEETPDLLSGESECEVELKLEEDKVEDENKISAIAGEDSDEDIFI